MLGGIMGMMGGGGPMGMINKLMQSVQQMQPQQGGESGQCSEGGGKNDPAQMFQQIMQQLTQGRAGLIRLHPRDLTWRLHAEGSACGRHSGVSRDEFKASMIRQTRGIRL